MNVFALHEDPRTAAVYHCDKHAIKMPLEGFQMLSTAHRVLDGTVWYDIGKNGRRIKRWALDGVVGEILYLASHVNHPCNIWVRESSANYEWLYELTIALCEEYQKRYGKEHLSYIKLNELVKHLPKNIARGPMTPFALAMPDEYKCQDHVESYRAFYIAEKSTIATWDKGTPAPYWFTQNQMEAV